MRKLTVFAFCAIAGLLLIFAVSDRSADAQAGSYAEDRALIEELQARYMFALDFGDVDKYLSTFTPDGVLDIGDGEIRGHDAIRKIIGGMPKKAASKMLRSSGRPRAGTTSQTLPSKLKATKPGKMDRFHYSNNNPQRTAAFDGYGHYEDEMAKVKGQWLFTKRRIYNENVDKWAAKPGNPCW